MFVRIRKPLLSVTLLTLIATSTSSFKAHDHKHVSGKGIFKRGKNVTAPDNNMSSWLGKYMNWNLQQAGVSQALFQFGIKGFSKLVAAGKIQQQQVITLIDFSKPSTQERLFIIDLLSGQILYKTLVAHGRNSGTLFAKKFSNEMSSFESSPGFYITSDTYVGKHGYSLKLNGVETGINHMAMERAIVLHGADYVSRSFIAQHGFLGRSLGCPAVPEAAAEGIIETIKNGSCLFVYAPVSKHLKRSKLLH